MFILLIFPSLVFAQSANVGIIQGIWFSADEFFAGDPIRIYTAIQNNSGEEIQGVVEFFDNDQSLGKKDFIAPDRRISELWIDSIITEGEHDYSVVITEASVDIPGESLRAVTPRVIESEDILVAEIDTDGDDIADRLDTDDDNDGFSDIDEIAIGTDPLDKDNLPISVESTNGSNANAVEISGDSNSSGSVVTENEKNLAQELIEALRTQPESFIVPSSDNEGGSDDDLTDAALEVSGTEPSNPDTAKVEQNVTLRRIPKPDDTIAVPAFIQSVEEKIPATQRVTTPLNAVQNVLVPRIEKERKRIQESVLEKEIAISQTRESSDPKKETLDPTFLQADTSEKVEQLIQSSERKARGVNHWVSLVYSYILMGLRLLFSCLICMILLIFLSIHLVLKLIFKIFTRRERL